ncbi:hypothetical protein [Cytophaga sp. FL35]|uniref:hypothetical protein n=1 Tax=Cytophaga sp. FL35 TaxID=1904456 RepID=UPI00165391B8|nr:hypothetical protein [Cytophaga sp. FL35]MBC7000804.1 hypothetical protein [Cytophaga sp. FL35]
MNIDLCYRIIQQFDLSNSEKKELASLLLNRAFVKAFDKEQHFLEWAQIDFKKRLMKIKKRNQSH